MFINEYPDITPPNLTSCEDMVDHFNSVQIIHNIAPIKNKKTAPPKAPQRKGERISLLERDCQKAERKWRKSKLLVHLGIYKNTLLKLQQGIETL